MQILRKYAFILTAIVVIILGCLLAWKHLQPPTDQDEPQDGIPILTYHKVNPDPKTGGLGTRVMPADFDWQMHYLKDNGYHSIDLGEVVDHFRKGKKLPDKPIVITFDDGYQDNYLYAYPVLKKYGFSATIFVVANTVGGINEFDSKTNIQPENKMLTWKEIKEMNDNGITIGAHTLDHVHLTKVSQAEAGRQISKSKIILGQELGKSIKYFCYPYGEYNQTVAELAEKSGYLAAVTTQPGLVRSAMNPYLLNRICITGYFSRQRFIEELNKY